MARSQPPKEDRSGFNDGENARAAMLDTLPTEDVVKLLVDEEAGAVKAVRARAAVVAAGAQVMADRLAAGGRLIYVGAGTAGRLGAMEAAESVPAFALPPSLVQSIVAGGPNIGNPRLSTAGGIEDRGQNRVRSPAGGGLPTRQQINGFDHASIS